MGWFKRKKTKVFIRPPRTQEKTREEIEAEEIAQAKHKLELAKINLETENANRDALAVFLTPAHHLVDFPEKD